MNHPVRLAMGLSSVVAQRQIPIDQTVQKTVETPQLQRTDRVIDGLVVQVETVEMPVTRTQEKTQHVVNTHVQHAVNAVEAEKPIINETINQVTKHVEIPQLQIVEKTIEAAKHIQQERVQNNTVAQIVDVPGSQTQEETVEVIQLIPQDRMSDHVDQQTVKELRSKFEVGHMSEGPESVGQESVEGETEV